MKNTIGIVRTHNCNPHLLVHVLEHNCRYCDLGIIVYDDCSTDGTVMICNSHPNVVRLVAAKEYSKDRMKFEFESRQRLLSLARQHGPEWILAFDSDEIVEFSPHVELNGTDAVAMKLYDFHMTPGDMQPFRLGRKWCGPEYRVIKMLFKVSDHLGYFYGDQREATIAPDAKVMEAGYVKHYGKAISIHDWEKKCRYYEEFYPEPYKTKWHNRKGKAIKNDLKSDFGAQLIQWRNRDRKGFLLKE